MQVQRAAHEHDPAVNALTRNTCCGNTDVFALHVVGEGDGGLAGVRPGFGADGQLAGLGAGEERYIRSDKVSEHMKSILPDCDLIVGTEEEVQAVIDVIQQIDQKPRQVLIRPAGEMSAIPNV